jgi:hypothetical protein
MGKFDCETFGAVVLFMFASFFVLRLTEEEEARQTTENSTMQVPDSFIK